MRAVHSDLAVSEGWQHASLGKLLPLKYGKSLPAQLRDPNGTHPVYGSSGMVGTHSAALTNGPTLIVGRKGNVGAIHYSAVPCWPIDTAYFVEAPVGHNLRYYKYLLESLNLVKLDRSTAIPGLSRDDYNAVEVSVAPPEQQDEIVAEIEKQFSRLDEAVANLQRVKANLKRYKASVLKDAVEGRLVPTEAELARREGRSFETGEQLLQRILETRRSQWSGRGKFKAPDAPETIGLVESPSGWVWASVAQLADVISGLTKNPSRETLPLKLPYLRVANVYANELRLDDMAEIGVADHELQKLLVLKNDLLVVEGNGSTDQIGRVAKWDGSISPCVHQNHLIKVRAIVAEPGWILNWLISPGGRKQIELVSSSTTGLHTLSSGKVGRLPIPLPPVAEQKRIVLEIDRRLSLIRGVESEVDANLKRAQALRQSTLSSAFQQVP